MPRPGPPVRSGASSCVSCLECKPTHGRLPPAHDGPRARKLGAQPKPKPGKQRPQGGGNEGRGGGRRAREGSWPVRGGRLTLPVPTLA